eukprot:scaffold4676_cov94-Isochrysis_galbana.AAC.1
MARTGAGTRFKIKHGNIGPLDTFKQRRYKIQSKIKRRMPTGGPRNKVPNSKPKLEHFKMRGCCGPGHPVLAESAREDAMVHECGSHKCRLGEAV